MIVNVLKCVGMNVAERVVRSRANTSEKLGTDEEGIVGALRYFGLDGSPKEWRSKNEAIGWIRNSLVLGNPVIICIQNLQHWAVIIGIIGSKFIVVDSMNTITNKKENGIHVVDQEKLSKMWMSKKKKYCAIIVEM